MATWSECRNIYDSALNVCVTAARDTPRCLASSARVCSPSLSINSSHSSDRSLARFGRLPGLGRFGFVLAFRRLIFGIGLRTQATTL